MDGDNWAMGANTLRHHVGYQFLQAWEGAWHVQTKSTENNSQAYNRHECVVTAAKTIGNRLG